MTGPLPGAPRPPAPPFGGMPQAPAAPVAPVPPVQAARAPDPGAVKEEYERKLAAMEKRLQDEREKVLMANLKSQQEAATSAKVEVAIKELQDKIRRDRRDQEHEELKHKLDNRVQELETRLAQERETWLVTLKNQMVQRETQDKDFESQFAVRLQEMERRWLEEKAHWQKTVGAKDDEVRVLRNLTEKLKGAEVEWQKVLNEKKVLEERVADLSKERAENQVKLGKGAEAEKESFQLRAELTLARQQLSTVSDRLERDLQSMRQSAREREDRLAYEVDRLQRELSGLGSRMRLEHEAEIKRVKDAADAERDQYKEKADRASSDVAKLKAVLSALERQAAMSRSQVMALRKQASEWEKTQEHYKAEFVVLQRRWADREREIRSEVEHQLQKNFSVEADKARIEAEERLRKELSGLADKLESRSREALLEKENELASLRAKVSELEVQKAGEQEERQAAEAALEEEKRRAETALEQSKRNLREEGTRLESGLRDAQEENGALKAALAELRKKFETAEEARTDLALEKSEFQRLSMAQAAELKNLQDSFFSLRGQLARDAQMAKAFVDEKERLEKRIKELERGGSVPPMPPRAPSGERNTACASGDGGPEPPEGA
ncbi:MAG: hypothetical protein HZB91_13130 [Elusimicrobia bacterium]|nr:hypothetical protein [Elusimicrobiota bacterium]